MKHKKSVLIAEDERSTASAIARKFEKEGYKVNVCYDGVSCIDALGTEDYDVVMLDLIMPKKNGFDILQEKADTKNSAVPVYVLTNLGDDDKADQAITLGAEKVFVKSRTSLKEVTSHVINEIGLGK
ncbi:MAG: response regulator [Patescibacteria group bacterium]